MLMISPLYRLCVEKKNDIITFFYWRKWKSQSSIRLHVSNELCKSTELWAKHLAILNKYLHNNNLRDLCKDSILQFAFMLNLPPARKIRMNLQLSSLIQDFSQTELKELLRESRALPLRLSSNKFSASQGRINHLYCWNRASKKLADVKLGCPQSILEFGGGYGGLVELLSRNRGFVTYTIIDFPEMLSLS